jgi:hypothetical protein
VLPQTKQSLTNNTLKLTYTFIILKLYILFYATVCRSLLLLRNFNRNAINMAINHRLDCVRIIHAMTLIVIKWLHLKVVRLNTSSLSPKRKDKRHDQNLVYIFKTRYRKLINGFVTWAIMQNFLCYNKERSADWICIHRSMRYLYDTVSRHRWPVSGPRSLVDTTQFDAVSRSIR